MVMDGCLMEIVMTMMLILLALNTGPVQGLYLLVLVLMSSVLAMADIEQVIDEEGNITMVNPALLWQFLCATNVHLIIFYGTDQHG